MTPSKIPGFNIALEIVTGIAVIIGFLVIFQSMYTAVLERTREIGILKSMGASQTTIVGVVLRECAVLAVAGVVVGIAGTYGVRLAMLHFFPTQHFEISSQWIGYAARSPSWDRSAARFIPRGWPREKIRSTRWPTSSL